MSTKLKILNGQELRDLLRVLTIEQARMEADKPSLLTRSTDDHRDLCIRINQVKAELNGDQAGQEAA